MKDIEKRAFFQHQIVEYWRNNGRKNLPWRNTKDPWLLLVAEMLLRKTTTNQAIAVYNELKNYSVDDIIKIRIYVLEEILKPLGLNKIRAKQLKSAAQIFKHSHLSDLRSDDFLRTMPGVGKYISNMVRCCAFGIGAPGLDTNMIRIIVRVFGWEQNRRRLREDRLLWSFAESLVPKTQCQEYNWGMFDFGAAVCLARNPKCSSCPLNSICNYYSKQKRDHPNE